MTYCLRHLIALRRRCVDLRGSAGGGLAAARAVMQHGLPMAASIAGVACRASRLASAADWQFLLPRSCAWRRALGTQNLCACTAPVQHGMHPMRNMSSASAVTIIPRPALTLILTLTPTLVLTLTETLPTVASRRRRHASCVCRPRRGLLRIQRHRRGRRGRDGGARRRTGAGHRPRRAPGARQLSAYPCAALLFALLCSIVSEYCARVMLLYSVAHVKTAVQTHPPPQIHGMPVYVAGQRHCGHLRWR